MTTETKHHICTDVQSMFRAYILDSEWESGKRGASFPSFFWYIIYRMLEFYKRHGRAFLTIGAGFLISGVQVLCFLGEHEYQQVATAILFALGVIFFVFGGRAVFYDYKDSRRKDEEQKRVEVRKALRESVKRLNPEYTEEQIDWWIDGK